MLAFGPVSSRRFGRSLAVNNVPPQSCSYACVYCRLGPPRSMRIRRRPFLPVQELVRAVQDKVAACRARREPVDHLIFVPYGEPTLDLLLRPEIRTLKSLGIPVGVITNGSLLWRPEVRADLAEADVVLVKADATDPQSWRRINRPGRQLRLPAILRGLEVFARSFPGELWTETTLVDGVNDDTDGVRRLVVFLEGIAPARAYVTAPTRPAAVPGARAPSAQAFVEAHEVFRERLPRVELLASPEECTFRHQPRS
jgi:wyosine [tRNA(Phe)-imidazoG37] synthetase (radical SAM superfamily)